MRESCYRFYKPPTRSFLWLQPKNPVEVVVESGRGPDPPDARALASARPEVAREAHANHRAEENRRGAAKVEAVNPRRGSRARAKQADAKAEEGRAQDVSAQAVAVLVVERSLPWLG